MDEDLRNNSELTEEEWNIIKASMQKITLEKGAVLFEDGSEENELYYLEEGSLAVIKKERHVASLKPGDWVGEIAALQNGTKRSASVKAKENSVLLKVSLSDLKRSTQADPEIFIKVLSSLSKVMASRLALSTEAKVIAIQRQLDLARLRIVMGQFLCYVLFAFTAFFYAVKIIKVLNIEPKVSSALNIPLLLLLSYFLILFIKNSGFPLSTFGLTWKNWKVAIVESVVLTVPLGLSLVLVKWALISTLPFYLGQPLFHFDRLLKMHLGAIDWLLMTVGYAIFVPLQALMVNGCLQGTFVKLFVGSKKTILSIVLSNLIFSILHLQLSLAMALGVFFIGCFWGWLYSRHHTILGISISHAIIGIWVGIFIGYH